MTRTGVDTMVKLVVIAPASSLRAALRSMRQNLSGVRPPGAALEHTGVSGLKAPGDFTLVALSQEGLQGVARLMERLPEAGEGLSQAVDARATAALLKWLGLAAPRDSASAGDLLDAVLGAAGQNGGGRSTDAPNTGAPSGREQGLPAPLVVGRDHLASLSRREREVLDLLALGAGNHRIARALYVSENTVKTHLRHIMGKLKTANRTQTALLARELLPQAGAREPSQGRLVPREDGGGHRGASKSAV